MDVVYNTPEGRQVYGPRTIGYVKDDVLYLNAVAPDIMIESEDQIEGLTPLVPVGTRFFLPGGQGSWQVGTDGTVTKDEIPGMFYLNTDNMNLYYNSEVE